MPLLNHYMAEVLTDEGDGAFSGYVTTLFCYAANERDAEIEFYRQLDTMPDDEELYLSDIIDVTHDTRNHA